jgi:hypothetical protein
MGRLLQKTEKRDLSTTNKKRKISANLQYVYKGGEADQDLIRYLLEAIVEEEVIVVSYPTKIHYKNKDIMDKFNIPVKKDGKKPETNQPVKIMFLDRICLPTHISSIFIDNETKIGVYEFGVIGNDPRPEENRVAKSASYEFKNIGYIKMDAEFIKKVDEKFENAKNKNNEISENENSVDIIDLSEYESQDDEDPNNK